MRVGFIILAHQYPEQAGELARHLSAQDAAVVIHYDRRAAGLAAVREAADGAQVIATQAAAWGQFGLVAATLDAARCLDLAELSHVCLLSGDTLPLRPVAELEGFLAQHPTTDFIETMPPDDWVIGGLGKERFTLHHPVGWKTQRALFDQLVSLQRRIGVSRRMPEGLSARLGRQWWCLTGLRLRQILNHPNLPNWQWFFRTVWIPDESFFQTLTASLAPDAARDGRGLMLAPFDRNGQPVTFHDDHIEMLESTDHFFLRKADPGAFALRRWAFNRAGSGSCRFEGRMPSRLTDPAPEHLGLQMAGRFQRHTGVRRPGVARPYLVLLGEPGATAAAAEALHKLRPEAVIHGRLFSPAPAEFAGGQSLYAGNLSGAPVLRDYRPEQFLARLLWIDRGRPVAFQLTRGDNPRIEAMIRQDPMARVAEIGAGPDLAELAALLDATAPQSV